MEFLFGTRFESCHITLILVNHLTVSESNHNRAYQHTAYNDYREPKFAFQYECRIAT